MTCNSVVRGGTCIATSNALVTNSVGQRDGNGYRLGTSGDLRSEV